MDVCRKAAPGRLTVHRGIVARRSPETRDVAVRRYRLRYSEGYYADGGNKAALWRSARASIGEAATAVHILAVEGRAPHAEAVDVRSLLSRAMQMLARLLQPR